MSTDTPISNGHIEGTSPLDGSPLEPVAVTSGENVVRAVARAREAQTIWAEHSPHDRATRLKALRKQLLSCAEAWAAIMHREQGKSTAESYSSEIIPSADLFTYWAKQAPHLLVPRAKGLNPINFPSKAGMLELVPRGVIALIAPWNFPVSIPLRTLVPALAAGNAVVFKPSEYAPRIGAALVELFDGLGVPGLVSLVQGGGDTGALLIDAGVDHVVFTGSVQSGQKVARACAEHLIDASLELGGKDAAIVLADADLKRTVEGLVWGAFMNGGQNCASVERVYAVEPIAPKLIDAIIARTKELVVGDGTSADYDIGPLVRPAGLATVEAHVKGALDAGAALRTGGKRTGVGLHYEPTVLTDVSDTMAVMAEETFGPVLPIAVVGDEEEAVARANQSPYGLTASIWTRDLEHGRALAKRLHAGVVTINNHGFTAAVPHAPWHGAGQSGRGVTNSRFAFYDLVEPRYVLVDRHKSKELWWFPHNAVFRTLAAALAVLGGGAGNKAAALITVLRSLPKRWKKALPAPEQPR